MDKVKVLKDEFVKYARGAISELMLWLKNQSTETVIQCVAYCKENDLCMGPDQAQRLRDVLMSNINLRNAELVESAVNRFSCISTILSLALIALGIVTIIAMFAR